MRFVCHCLHRAGKITVDLRLDVLYNYAYKRRLLSNG